MQLVTHMQSVNVKASKTLHYRNTDSVFSLSSNVHLSSDPSRRRIQVHRKQHDTRRIRANEREMSWAVSRNYRGAEQQVPFLGGYHDGAVRRDARAKIRYAWRIQNPRVISRRASSPPAAGGRAEIPRHSQARHSNRISRNIHERVQRT